jgi:hypothetical protein
VYQPSYTQARAHVVGDTDLLRAGLERAARQVGMAVVDAEEDASVTLRHSGDQGSVTPITVTVEPAVVTMSFRSVPNASEWEALRTLVTEVLVDPAWDVGNSLEG